MENINEVLGDSNFTDYNRVFDLPDIGEIVAVLCHFNPCNFHSPTKNIKQVLTWLFTQNIPTYAVELRCGESLNLPPILNENHEKVIQIRSNNAIFLKDNLWNVAAKHLPLNFQYILFLDADVIINGQNWKEELVSALKVKKIVQPFSKAVWTDSNGKRFKEKISCGFGFATNSPNPQISHNFHSGFAIAVHRDFFDHTPGFFNSPIGGGSLFLMSGIMGLQNELEPSLEKIAPLFLQSYNKWATQIFKWADKQFSYTNSEAWHLWHGSRQKRRYFDRFEIIKDFDPDVDIIEKKPFGVQDWSEGAKNAKKELIKGVEGYFGFRDEDEVFIS